MRTQTKRFSLTAATLMISPVLLQAADGAANTAGKDGGEHFNAILVGLVSLVLVLLFAIGILGNVLRQLGIAYRDKMRAERSKVSIAKGALLIIALMLPAAQLFAQDAAATDAPASAPVSRFISGIPKDQFYALMGILTLEMVVIISLVMLIRTMVRIMTAKPETASAAKQIVARVPFWDRLNKSVAVEREQDIMLDHDYDGIRELDNSLPPWWKYGFYLTILVAVVYVWYYHAGGNGPSSYQEYMAEVKKGEAEKQAYLAGAANKVDENTVKMGDAASIAAGQNIFQSTCAACHAKDGGGGVGPNLTDDYWLHGGSIQDVFKSIKYGWTDKGMKSWKDDFSPKQIADLASYVKSLKGSKPAAPKEKQGELYTEGGAPATSGDKTKSVAVK